RTTSSPPSNTASASPDASPTPAWKSSPPPATWPHSNAPASSPTTSATSSPEPTTPTALLRSFALPSASGAGRLPSTGNARDRCIAPTRPGARCAIRFSLRSNLPSDAIAGVEVGAWLVRWLRSSRQEPSGLLYFLQLPWQSGPWGPSLRRELRRDRCIAPAGGRGEGLGVVGRRDVVVGLYASAHG